VCAAAAAAMDTLPDEIVLDWILPSVAVGDLLRLRGASRRMRALVDARAERLLAADIAAGDSGGLLAADRVAGVMEHGYATRAAAPLNGLSLLVSAARLGARLRRTDRIPRVVRRVGDGLWAFNFFCEEDDDFIRHTTCVGAPRWQPALSMVATSVANSIPHIAASNGSAFTVEWTVRQYAWFRGRKRREMRGLARLPHCMTVLWRGDLAVYIGDIDGPGGSALGVLVCRARSGISLDSPAMLFAVHAGGGGGLAGLLHAKWLQIWQALECDTAQAHALLGIYLGDERRHRGERRVLMRAAYSPRDRSVFCYFQHMRVSMCLDGSTLEPVRGTVREAPPAGVPVCPFEHAYMHGAFIHRYDARDEAVKSQDAAAAADAPAVSLEAAAASVLDMRDRMEALFEHFRGAFRAAMHSVAPAGS